jgi:hypothetical protein
VLRGTIGFVVPSLDDLKKRLESAGKEMKRVVPEKQTKFSWREKDGAVEATCPWGNRVRCHAPAPEFGRTELGIAYVDFDVPHGHARGHRALLQRDHEAPARRRRGRASVSIGRNQMLHFTETSKELPPTTTTISRSTSPTSAARTIG